jgi:hypothetical protein
MSEWQPIETAPKDSSSVILWPYDAEITVGYFRDVEISGWYCEIMERFFEPTHWMPLPAPPEDIQS